MMSGGSNGYRVSTIPGNVRKMIQNIKEIGSNHSEEDIYATLKDCGMDPNETAQKLLLQDTFHEVKRKRDKKKEILNNRENADSRRRSGRFGQVGRGGQGNFSSRYPADVGGGKHSVSATENGMKGSAGSTLSAPSAKEAKIKETVSSSSATLSDSNLTHMPLEGNSDEHTSHISSIISAKDTEVSSAKQSQSGVMGKLSVSLEDGVDNEYGQPQPSSNNSSGSVAVISGGHSSASDPVLVRSNESTPPGAIGAIDHDNGSEQSHSEPSLSAGSKFNAGISIKAPCSSHEIRSLSTHTRMGSKPRGTGKNQLTEFSRPPSSSGHGQSSSRPSSNYDSRSQQAIGPPKGLSKEWKPKTTNPSNVLVSLTSSAAQQSSSAEKTDEQGHAVHASISSSEEALFKVERELEGLHMKETQHVIIPNHIHVPDAVRTGLSFGSFDAALVFNSSRVNVPAIEKGAEQNSVSYQAVEDLAVEQAASNDNIVAPLEEGDSIDHPQSSIHVPENVSSGSADVLSSSVSAINISQETFGVPQQPVVHASPAYNLSVVPTPALGNMAPFDSSDPQVRDASRVASFVMQQPVDPASANYYAQYYHSSEGDHISPFPSSGVSTMYNGNIATLTADMSESSQKVGNHVALSAIGHTPLATQAGVMASNMTATQQGVPMFRQPPGMPMPHYPTNFIPYGHYFPPFYVPSAAIPQFLGNNAFLQQGQTSSIYPGPPTGAPAPVKYPLSQFKSGSNPGNPAHLGVNGSYGPYGTSPAGYNTGSAATASTSSTNNDGLAGLQYRENIMYTAGQQSEGSAMWIAAPGRDVSGLQANSFYNIPPQGQHVTLTPSQAGHSPFASAYHPSNAGTLHPLLQQSQAMSGASDMVGAPPAGVYQQLQHATQMNWTNNY